MQCHNEVKEAFMSHRSQLTAVLLAATSVFALSACVSGNESEEAKESEIEITTPTGAPAPEFKAEETDPLISDEILSLIHI